MIALSLSNISLVLGAKRIFSGLNWEIQHDQKIGLIGPNGAGKSSLLKLILGELSPEPGGVMTRAKGLSVGYLAQQPDFEPDQTAFSAALVGNPRYIELRSELEQIEASLGDPQVYNDLKALERVLANQERCLEEYTSLGGDNYPGRRQRDSVGSGAAAQRFRDARWRAERRAEKAGGIGALVASSPGCAAPRRAG